MKNSHYIIEQDIIELKRIILINQEMVNTPFVANTTIEKWEKSLETLTINCIYKSYSIIELCNGFAMEFYKKTDTIFSYDLTSINLIARGLLENYLTLDYLYFNTIPIDDQIFRVKLWEVSGLIARGRLNFDRHKELNGNIRKFIEDKLKSERDAIESIMNELKAMPQYLTLTQPQIRKLESFGLPRIRSWSQVIKSSSLNTDFFQNAYSLLCNNAHSEFLSVLQISQTNPAVNLNSIISVLTKTKLLNCMLIKKMVQKFKSCEIVYNTLPLEETVMIETYYNAAK